MLEKVYLGFEGGMNAIKYVSITSTSKATAMRDLQDLVAKGIFKPLGGRGSTRCQIELATIFYDVNRKTSRTNRIKFIFKNHRFTFAKNIGKCDYEFY